MGSASHRAGTAWRARAAAVAVALAALGCAHVAPRPPAPRPPAPRNAGRPAAPSTVPDSQARSAPGPEPRPPASLDPSEVMTPEELATIPDPVPPAPAAGDTAAGAIGQERAPDVPPPADHSPGSPGDAQDGPPEGPTAGAAVWRVQIFASPDLKLADRQAKEASARLGAPASIEFEEPLYKVRLGNFATEGEAQALRDRAVREGYPGAFRVRASKVTNNDRRKS